MIPLEIGDYDKLSAVIYYFDIMITGQIPSYDVMLGVIYDYDVIIPGGIGHGSDLAAAGSSMHEARTEHVLSHQVGIGILADAIIDDGLSKALQAVRHGS